MAILRFVTAISFTHENISSYPILSKIISLRLPSKARNGTMASEGLVSSLFGFVVMPSLLFNNNTLHEKNDRMAALSITIIEIRTIEEEVQAASYMAKALPFTQFVFLPNYTIRLYKEKENQCCGLAEGIRVRNKEVTVTDDVKSATYGASPVMLSQACTNDRIL